MFVIHLKVPPVMQSIAAVMTVLMYSENCPVIRLVKLVGFLFIYTVRLEGGQWDHYEVVVP